MNPPNIDEPLYFNLIREAESLLDTNPRSALIMIAVSIEVGTKQFLKKIQPKADWLISEIQSPPIPKLIEFYFPQLIPEMIFEKDLIKDLKTIFERRNALVHSGEFTLSKESLFAKFTLAVDLLYYFNMFEGSEWINEGIHISKGRLKIDTNNS